MQQSNSNAPSQVDPKAQTLAAASRLLPDIEFLHVVSMRPSEVCLVARERPAAGSPDPAPFIVYLFQPVTDPDHIQHFRDSAKMLMSLEHHSLGVPHKFGFASDHPYFFVTIPPGSSLTQLHDSKQLSPSHVVQIIPEVCSALEAAHQQGVSHHSLTPDDIIIAPDGTITILRLGFTEMLVRNPAERLAFVADTPAHLRHYIAPEQNDIQATADHRADIYSIGSILYELFTGRKIGGFFILPSSVSRLEKRVDDLISIALQHSPDNRFATIDEFGTYLTTVRFTRPEEDDIDGRLSEATAKEYLTTHTVTGISPLKRILVAAIALVLILAGCTALYFNFVKDPGPDQTLVNMLNAMHELDGTTMTDQQRAEKYAEIGEILSEVGPDKETLLLAIDVMQRLGDREATQKVLEEYIAALPEDTANLEELRAVIDAYYQNVEYYDAAMEEAYLARSKGDDEAELAALEKALSFLPYDCHAQAQRGQNPIHIDRWVGAAMALARRHTPPGEEFSASYIVRRGGVDIDLSDNPSFKNLFPFSALPIEELDLSNTGVSDLTPLAGMSIRKLWLDDTPVSDLSVLLGMPLDTLTFENCPVEDPAVIGDFELLTTIRYTTPSGQREFTIPTPSLEEPWENDLGMRFVPLQIPGSKILFARWETRRMDFAEFAANAGSLLEENGDDTPAWSDQSLGRVKRHPVSAVSLVDARAFCKWLTGHSQAAGFLPSHARFRLPTDYEWSHAAGLDDHPMLSPAVRALQGAPLLASTEPGIVPVARTAPTSSKIHGLWDNVREWTSTPADAGTAAEFAVRGLYSRPAGDDTVSGVSVKGLYDHPARENTPEIQISGDIRTRYPTHATERKVDTGFRIVLDLGEETVPTASLPELVAAGNRDGAKKLAVDLINNSDDLEIQEAARMYVELEEVETHFKRFRRLPPGLKKQVKYFQGRRYCLVRLPLDWTTAMTFSGAIGGHLATLTSPEELDWVLGNLTNPRDVATMWVDATPASEGSTTWVWRSSSSTANLPTSDQPIPPSERLLILPRHVETPPAPPTGEPATLDETAAPEETGEPEVAPEVEETIQPPGPATPEIWHQAPGHQRHFFLVEWG